MKPTAESLTHSMIKKETFSSSLVVFSVAGSDPAPAAAFQSVGKGAERRRAGEQVSLFVFKHGDVCKFSSLRHLWFNIFLFPHFFLFPSHFLLHPFNFSSSFTSPPSFYAAVLLSSFFLPLLFFLSSYFPSSRFLAILLSLYSHLFFLPFFPSHLPCFSSPLYSFLYSSFPLKFVSVLPLVTSSSLCPPQHGSRCVEQSWRGVAGSGKHRRRHWVFSHRLGAGSQQPHPALHHHSQSAMRKTHTQSVPACHFTNTHTHRPVKRCTAKPSHTHKLRVYIEMQRVQINRLPSVHPCFPQCLSCGHVPRLRECACLLPALRVVSFVISLRSLKVVFTCCLVQIHTHTLWAILT